MIDIVQLYYAKTRLACRSSPHCCPTHFWLFGARRESKRHEYERQTRWADERHGCRRRTTWRYGSLAPVTPRFSKGKARTTDHSVRFSLTVDNIRRAENPENARSAVADLRLRNDGEEQVQLTFDGFVPVAEPVGSNTHTDDELVAVPSDDDLYELLDATYQRPTYERTRGYWEIYEPFDPPTTSKTSKREISSSGGSKNSPARRSTSPGCC